MPTHRDATPQRGATTKTIPTATPRGTRQYGGDAGGRAPIAVIAVGNAGMGDDAFGPSTLGVLESHWQWPSSVELVDAGTCGVELPTHIVGRERVILLDTVKSDAQPGTVVSWQKQALVLATSTPAAAPAPHAPGLRHALASAATDGALPEDLLLIGVVPYARQPGSTLSPLVEVACRIAAIEVVRRVKGWGADVRIVPAARAWWKAAV